MLEFLGQITTFFGASLGWVKDILTHVSTSTPLTVLVLGFPIVAFGYGLLKRLIRM